jgi:hypothetical protein
MIVAKTPRYIHLPQEVDNGMSAIGAKRTFPRRESETYRQGEKQLVTTANLIG